MSSDEKRPPLEVVAENSDEAVRQRALEREVQQRFATVAASILDFLTDAGPIDLDAMEHFPSLHREAEAKSIDPKGIGIRVPLFGPPGADEHINSILRGSMRMAAVMLREMAERPAEEVTKHEKYKAARDEIISGIQLLQRRVGDLGEL